MINIKITIINRINVKAKASLNSNVYTGTHLELSRVGSRWYKVCFVTSSVEFVHFIERDAVRD